MSNISISDRFRKAVRLEKSRDYKNAFQEYLSIIDQNSRFRDAYINLGSLCSRMDNFPDALKYYNVALSLRSDYLTLFNIGCVLYKTGRYAEAAENLERSITMNKSFILSKLVAGLSYSRMNTFEKAEHYFSEVLKSHPRSRPALIALAVIYYHSGRLGLSLRLLDGILRTNPGDIKMRELRADILMKTGAIDESASEIKAIKRRADKYKYFDEFIQSVPVEIYTDRYGSIDEKIDSLNARINEGSSNLISLSLCYLLKGDTDAAIDYLFSARKN